jgi:membrane-bound serine protease (ClpP class)
VFQRADVVGQLMHTVASPNVAYVLFVLGLALLLFELFTAGGRGRPGGGGR